MLQLTTIRVDVPLPDMDLARCALSAINWPGGSQARAGAGPSGTAGPVSRSAAGPGLDDVPFPEE
jgi:hypothetical protein